MARLRFGVVTEFDPATVRARVRFDDDGLLSWWLFVGQARTLHDKHYDPVDPDEHVACLVDEHTEDGVIVCAIYSTQDKPPVEDPDLFHRRFKDGSFLEVNRKTGKGKLYLTGDLDIEAEGQVSIVGSPIHLNNEEI